MAGQPWSCHRCFTWGSKTQTQSITPKFSMPVWTLFVFGVFPLSYPDLLTDSSSWKSRSESFSENGTTTFACVDQRCRMRHLIGWRSSRMSLNGNGRLNASDVRLLEEEVWPSGQGRQVLIGSILTISPRTGNPRCFARHRDDSQVGFASVGMSSRNVLMRSMNIWTKRCLSGINSAMLPQLPLGETQFLPVV